GSQSALGELPDDVDAVVSLSRVGTDEVPAGVESIRVWLIDTPGHNANLDFVLTQAADAIADLRSEGHHVFVHCAEARSRTAAVAALYGARHRGVPLDDAWTDVRGALPYYAPAEFHRRAVERILTPAAPGTTSEDS
ncbi:MAG TPA: dual specificity protein phosphatase family protein, partial [Candidatus Limnocylindrales bacterium]